MQTKTLTSVLAGAALLALILAAAWLNFPPGSGGRDSSKPSGEDASNLRRADSKQATSRNRDSLSPREVSPAADLAWRAPDVDPRSLDVLLRHPPSQFDVFGSVEWVDMHAWVAAPDVGGPWSIARRECAEQKLGTVAGEPCEYMVNLVFRRGADGAGEVVGAVAEFDQNVLGDEPDYHGPDPSSASARCQQFARCLVARGFAKLAAPLPPGPAGELIALQLGGTELPRRESKEAAEKWLDAAIEATLRQLKMFEDAPQPDQLSWQFNIAALRRSLEYYRWLKTQI